MQRYRDLTKKEKDIVDSQQHNYVLPISIAYKPDSVSTTVRLCMDAFAKTAGKSSLNDCLYKGSTSFYMSNMVTRWKSLKLGLATDLSKFYPSFRLRTEDWSLQFLWMVPSLMQGDEPELYCVTSLIFGVASVAAQSEATMENCTLI